MKNNRGVILVISMVVMAVLLVVTGVYFLGLMSEKRSVDTEKGVLQALNLAEAGASHGLSELRLRITNLVSNLNNSNVRNRSQVDVDPVVFLRSFGVFGGTGTGPATFSLSANAANDLGAELINGNYQVNVSLTSAKAAESSSNPDKIHFFYNYSIESTGIVSNPSPNLGKIIVLTGSFDISVNRANFSRFALFTSHHKMPAGTTVWFTSNTTFTGPVHTNDRFSFANNPSAHFSEEVTQHETRARFYNEGWPILSDSDYNSYIDPDTNTEVILDKPIFDNGFLRGQDIINLPSSVSQADLKKAAMGQTSDNFSNGIHVPNNGTSVTGGIYIKGNQGQNSDNAIITMTAGTNGPVYNIKQGTAGVTTTITVDYTANSGAGSTTVKQGTSPAVTYSGLPDGTTNEGIIIYANDDIGVTSGGNMVSGVSGVVQKDTALTISSEKDLGITGNIVYEKDPSVSGNENYANLLGLLSWGGNVRIGTTAPNDITIDGIVMAPTGIFTVDQYNQGSSRGLVNLFGGAITDFYGPFGTFSGNNPVSGYGRNFVYDVRMLTGKNPPYFPYMDSFTCSTSGLSGTNVVKPLWQDR